MPRDFTKYQFNGQVYGKGRLVLAVLKDYVSRKQPTLTQLRDAFPADIQGRKGLFCTEEEYNEKLKISDDVTKRYFNKEDEKLSVQGQKILVSTQWGEGNISQFVEQSKALGIHIEITKNKLTNEEVIQEFLHNKAFKNNYINWSEDVLNSFCTLMLFANENGLDIFTTKMTTGGAIRIGRKGHDHSVAQEVLATFEPQAETIIYRGGDFKVALSPDSVADICGSNDLQNFSQRLPITRDAYWPRDYLDASLSGIPRIWKVSHSPISFGEKELNWLTEHQMLAVHESTGNGSADNFREMNIGDVVSLGHGNTVFRLVRVISDIEYDSESPLSDEWLMRKYEVIKSLDRPVKYKGENKRWSPRFNGTSWEVPKNELWMFEEEILQPYYGITLEDLGFDAGQIFKPQTKRPSVEIMNKVPLNQILYGPPGTGKTYHSIQAAVKAADPEAYSKLCINEELGTTAQQREELTRIYSELSNSGRIRFVTFHQSYGYEEFVEGLKAFSDDGNISYDVEAGVFKKICVQALQGDDLEDEQLERAIEQFKIEIEEDGPILNTDRGKKFAVQYHGNKTLRVFPQATVNENLSRGYPVSIDNIRKLYRDASADGIYNSSYAKAILNHIKKKYTVSDYSESKNDKNKNYVLVIDEINRGNISKIFGELITLIEPSKRLGRAEPIEVILPYSGDKFSVPDNLYIIGTMNTADRSLALMDTALRRRFDFVEMMPDYNVLRDEQGKSYSIESEGYLIDLARLLETMNNRISALYDREHQLGHAFFMPVVNAIVAGKEEKALTELKNCFQNKIIPLLAEYFFEDWQKVRLVLGDNQKEHRKLDQLIKRSVIEFDSLFGETEDLDLIEDKEHEYWLVPANSPLWLDPKTYVGMYDLGQVVG